MTPERIPSNALVAPSQPRAREQRSVAGKVALVTGASRGIGKVRV
jgi:hypothetical protein